MPSVVVKRRNATQEFTKGRLASFSSGIFFLLIISLLARGTYFCPRCQTNSETLAAKKGSLLGWATTTTAASNLPSWQCQACTLNNKGGSLACSACGSKAPSSPASSTTSSWTYLACTLTNKAGNLTCSACSGPRPGRPGKTENRLGGSVKKGVKRKREDGGDQTSKKVQVLGTNRNVQTNSPLEVNVNNQPSKEPPVSCTGHSKPCIVKMVNNFL